ncbi:MAG: MFS transporter [Alphaproteobacteria bacterium]|nr:MFS transporter [Alphaproteobacteria bacterium]
MRRGDTHIAATADIEAGRSEPALHPRHVAAVTIGNALEFYDFLTFAFFAVYIGRSFFPSTDPSSTLLNTLATFGAGFLTRPLGAIVIGSMGDRIGRRPALLVSFGLMGAAIVGLALTPSYEAIGVAAPILVIFWRLVQGFALGGEVGPSTAFLIEAAPLRSRGFYVSLQSASQQLAVLASGLIGTALAASLSEQQLQDWGWRVAMLLGAVIVPVGLVIRRNLPETHSKTGGPRPPIAPHVRVIVLGLLMLAYATIGTYVINYMATYALTTLHLPPTISFGVIIVQGVTAIAFIVGAGALSDRIGRKPVMLIGGTVLLFSILPAFWVMTQWPGVYVFYACVAALVALQGITAAPVIVLITEQLPAGIRSGVVAIVYAFAISIFGGSAQYIVALIQKLSGDPLAPAYYWTAALAVGLTAMSMIRESAPRLVPRVAD